MCGLYGMLTKFKQSGFMPGEIKRFAEMATLTSIRGMDSSGMWGINKNKLKQTPRVWKTVGDPFMLTNSNITPEIVEFMDKQAIAMFGHGRSATSGKVTKQNAHPFVYKNITLMHNGTLHGGLEGKDKEVDVDSHALTMLVQEKGVMAALGQVEGAFAIIAYDTDTQKIYIARNYQRDLHYVELNDLILIMSDYHPLYYILQRMGRDKEQVYSFDPMKLYEIDPEHPKIGARETIKDTKLRSFNYRHQYPGMDLAEDIPVKQIGFHGTSGTTKTHSSNSSKGTITYIDDKEWPVKKDQMVYFKIDDVQKAGEGTWKYTGFNHNYEIVIFFYREMNENWVGHIGKAPVRSCSQKKEVFQDGRSITNWIIYLSPSEIEWKEKNTMTAEEMRDIASDKSCKCVTCQKPFLPSDMETAYIVDKDHRMFQHWECEVEVNEAVREIIHDARGGNVDNPAV